MHRLSFFYVSSARLLRISPIFARLLPIFSFLLRNYHFSPLHQFRLLPFTLIAIVEMPSPITTQSIWYLIVLKCLCVVNYYFMVFQCFFAVELAELVLTLLNYFQLPLLLLLPTLVASFVFQALLDPVILPFLAIVWIFIFWSRCRFPPTRAGSDAFITLLASITKVCCYIVLLRLTLPSLVPLCYAAANAIFSVQQARKRSRARQSRSFGVVFPLLVSFLSFSIPIYRWLAQQLVV